ncbi:unnamed protein product [Nesidiocoris tenuis]|uniref:Uncharacterized protein n=1 Tax=Nesidiocoris tenuis TaxID=355587 RepID=A0A6H5HII3_9HEMI|nr:unnamed protein product [Nesidiocoris tenuis]
MEDKFLLHPKTAITRGQFTSVHFRHWDQIWTAFWSFIIALYSHHEATLIQKIQLDDGKHRPNSSWRTWSRTRRSTRLTCVCSRQSYALTSSDPPTPGTAAGLAWGNLGYLEKSQRLERQLTCFTHSHDNISSGLNRLKRSTFQNQAPDFRRYQTHTGQPNNSDRHHDCLLPSSNHTAQHAVLFGRFGRRPHQYFPRCVASPDAPAREVRTAQSWGQLALAVQGKLLNLLYSFGLIHQVQLVGEPC